MGYMVASRMHDSRYQLHLIEIDAVHGFIAGRSHIIYYQLISNHLRSLPMSLLTFEPNR